MCGWARAMGTATKTHTHKRTNAPPSPRPPQHPLRPLLETCDSRCAMEEAWRGAAILEPAATRAYGVRANYGRGRRGASEEALEEARREEALEVARARVVVGVAGLVTFLIAIAPVEEVTRVTKR